MKRGLTPECEASVQAGGLGEKQAGMFGILGDVFPFGLPVFVADEFPSLEGLHFDIDQGDGRVLRVIREDDEGIYPLRFMGLDGDRADEGFCLRTLRRDELEDSLSAGVGQL